ncbi:hypothetical protein TH53_21900 [Pedobacter lusitanus]|uniref:DUF4935 domain-containing protein n=1 Tax=Pedobacter lusitanus TaxID=1503925 RepID=A0A0D0FRT8_9SPHI|nr:PIN domain-containing protein [Pedobacter lusitanus]KIO75189.1 hypothetical protein TH53_21900 [Pedobacter lusitanus]
MDVILDSNIYRDDILLRSKYFDLLNDYLIKTNSSIVLPQIVLDETKELYLRALQQRQSKIRTNINELNLALIDKTIHNSPPTIDINLEVEKYELYIKRRLNIKKEKVIPINNDFLPEIIKRCIKRQKPAGEKYEARDTLIWLTIKQYCENTHQKQVTLISKNHSDFAGSDKKTLERSLIAECDLLQIRINYFQSVEEFIAAHATEISFINEDWLAENLDFEVLKTDVFDSLNNSNKKTVYSYFTQKTKNKQLIFKPLLIQPYDDDFFIYEMIDNSIIVNAIIKAELKIEFKYIPEDSCKTIEHFNCYSQNKDQIITIEYLYVALHIIITVKNRKTFKQELSSLQIIN